MCGDVTGLGKVLGADGLADIRELLKASSLALAFDADRKHRENSLQRVRGQLGDGIQKHVTLLVPVSKCHHQHNPADRPQDHPNNSMRGHLSPMSVTHFPSSSFPDVPEPLPAPSHPPAQPQNSILYPHVSEVSHRSSRVPHARRVIQCSPYSTDTRLFLRLPNASSVAIHKWDDS